MTQMDLNRLVSKLAGAMRAGTGIDLTKEEVELMAKLGASEVQAGASAFRIGVLLSNRLADTPRSHSAGAKPEQNSPRAYSVKSLAEWWSCSEPTIRNLIETGQLEAFKLGNLIRIRREVVERFEAIT